MTTEDMTEVGPDYEKDMTTKDMKEIGPLKI
jgi:hypothetical protein